MFDIVKMVHFGLQVGLFLPKGLDLETAQSLNQKLGFVVRGFGHLEDQGAAAHSGQIVFRPGLGILLLLGNQQSDNPVLAHGLIHQLERILLHNDQRQHHLGEKRGIEQGQDRKNSGKVVRIILYRGFIVGHQYLLGG